MKETQNLKLKTQNSGIKLFLLGLLTSVHLLSKPKATPDDLKKMEFSSSSQRLGLWFSDKIRDIFRRRWIKKAGK
jgi:hypothetical protein